MKYETLQFDEDQILHLYQSNQWTNYTKDSKSLFNGIKQSLYTYAAYDDDTLVGLIRVVGDGHTIIYIQDLLVLPKYHRQGICSVLINHILDRYKDVRQVVLTTDMTPEQQSFYESIGFLPYRTKNIQGYYWNT